MYTVVPRLLDFATSVLLLCSIQLKMIRETHQPHTPQTSILLHFFHVYAALKSLSLSPYHCARSGTARYGLLLKQIPKKPDISFQTTPHIWTIFENVKFLRFSFHFGPFFCLFGPPASKIAKSQPLTLGQARFSWVQKILKKKIREKTDFSIQTTPQAPKF